MLVSLSTPVRVSAPIACGEANPHSRDVMTDVSVLLRETKSDTGLSGPEESDRFRSGSPDEFSNSACLSYSVAPL